MKRIAILSILSIGLVACASSGGPSGNGPGTANGAKPGWVDGRSTRYDDTMYLRGVGIGDTPQICDNRARAELAKIFHAHIRQASSDWQHYFTKVSAAGSVRVEAMDIRVLTQVSTDYVIQGSEVKERWQNYCLAVIDRMQAARRLVDEMDRLDVQIAAYVREGDKATDATSKFMHYKKAMSMLEKRQALNVELRIVAHRSKPALTDWATLVSKFTTAKANIKVGLKLTGSKVATLQTCLAEQLTKEGIQVQEASSDIDMIIHGTVTMAKAGYVLGSHMVRAEMNVRINNVENGKTIAAFSENVKVGRPQIAQSQQLAVSKLCDKIIPQLVQKIQASFTR